MMQDKTTIVNNENANTPSKAFREYLESLVEEIVINSAVFNDNKKYLQRYSQEEGLDYAMLEKNLTEFLETVEELKTHESKAVERLAKMLAKDCYLDESKVDELLAAMNEAREKEEAKRKAREKKAKERMEKEKAEHEAAEKAKRKAEEEARHKAEEEAKRRAKEEAERKAREERERKAKEEAERKEREKKEREEAECKAKEEIERKVKEEQNNQIDIELIIDSVVNLNDEEWTFESIDFNYSMKTKNAEGKRILFKVRPSDIEKNRTIDELKRAFNDTETAWAYDCDDYFIKENQINNYLSSVWSPKGKFNIRCLKLYDGSSNGLYCGKIRVYFWKVENWSQVIMPAEAIVIYEIQYEIKRWGFVKHKYELKVLSCNRIK